MPYKLAGAAMSAVYGNAGINGEDSNFDTTASGGTTYTANGGGKVRMFYLCYRTISRRWRKWWLAVALRNLKHLGNRSCTAGAATQTNISPFTGYGNNGGANQQARQFATWAQVVVVLWCGTSVSGGVGGMEVWDIYRQL